MIARPYQTRTIEHVNSLKRRFRVCLSLPTGSGKSFCMSQLVAQGGRQYVITHRRVLLDQLSRVLTERGIEHGMVAAGYRPQLEKPVQLCIWQTLQRRPELPPADFVHIDELHCMGGDKCLGIFNSMYESGASIIGYTATPSDISKSVDSVYTGATIRELIDGGYLTPPLVYGCGQPDLKMVENLKRQSNGEFSPTALDKLVKPQYIFGHVVEHYRRLNTDGRPYILFAHSVKTSIWWAQHMTAQGIPTAHIDGDDVWRDGVFSKSSSAERQRVFEDVQSGRLRGITNRFVMREGVDLPCVGHVILTAPIGSRRSFVQACGRALRPFPGREYAIIQDHSGSSLYLPALDSDESWDWQSQAGLAERVRISRLRANPNGDSFDPLDGEDDVREPIICPQCRAQRYVGDTCPQCGFKYAKRCRFVVQVNGQLKVHYGRVFRPRNVKHQPNDAAIWDRMFRAARRKSSTRTPEQLYSYFAYQNNWRWMPRDLPGMPKDEAVWFKPVCDIKIEELIPA